MYLLRLPNGEYRQAIVRDVARLKVDGIEAFRWDFNSYRFEQYTSEGWKTVAFLRPEDVHKDEQATTDEVRSHGTGDGQQQ